MKRNLTVLLFGCLLAVLLGSMLGCDLEGSGQSVVDSAGEVEIDRLPVFSSPSTVTSRSIFPSDMVMGDAYYSIFAPALSKFETTSGSFYVGDSLEIKILSSTIAMETSITDEGYIRLSGAIMEKDIDQQDVETGKVEILYDKANSKFSYYSEILVADPNGILQGWGIDTHMYVIHEIPFTQIEDDNSFLASFQTLAYLKSSSGFTRIIIFDDGEFYSGPGDSGGWFTGFASTSQRIISADDIENANIDTATKEVLIDSEGYIVAKNLFDSRRSAVVAARDDLFQIVGIVDSPMLGFKITNGSTTDFKVYTDKTPNENNDGFYLVGLDMEYLKDYEGEEIVFVSDSIPIVFYNESDPDNSRIELSNENLQKLKSGIPNQVWRNSSNLRVPNI